MLIEKQNKGPTMGEFALAMTAGIGHDDFVKLVHKKVEEALPEYVAKQESRVIWLKNYNIHEVKVLERDEIIERVSHKQAEIYDFGAFAYRTGAFSDSRAPRFTRKKLDRIGVAIGKLLEMHVDRCMKLGLAFAQFLGHPNPYLIALGLFLHDIGKLTLAQQAHLRSMLLNVSTLTDDQFEMIKLHVSEPFVRWMLDQWLLVSFDELPREIQEIIALHHCRLNGGGYRDLWPGYDFCYDTSYAAQIATVVDAFEAMTSDSRLYKKNERGKHPIDAIADLLREAYAGRLDLQLVLAFRDFYSQGIGETTINLPQVIQRIYLR